MKMLRVLLALLALEALLLSTAGAAGLSGLLSSAGELPDPADLLGNPAFLYEEEMMDGGVAYTAFTFSMPRDYEGFLAEYIPLAEAAGYAVSEDSILDMDAHRFASGAKAAYLVANYRGALLFLVNPGLDYAALPTPTPTPRPTPKPTPKPASTASSYTPSTGGAGAGGGRVEYIEVKQDCFACVGGRCDLCNGSGWYRMYGESVPCTTYCTTCDGLGYWYTRQPVWTP